uniref:Protein grindelwald n=1 Tax=Anopheles atroparvus TaxID=41427 RepID=A0A182J4K1_ANOAO
MRKTMHPRRMLPPWLILAVVGISTVLVGSVRAESCDKDNPYCASGEYCDPHTYSCKSCAAICARKSLDCIEKCKDYLIVSELQASINNRTIVIWFMLAVILVLLIGVIVLLLKIKKVSLQCPQLPWQKKNETTPTVAMTHENPNTKSPTRPPKNPANLTRQNTQQTTASTLEQDVENQTTITTISNRYPAEDSTEGLAYVNHACNVTPTSNGSAPRY